MKEPEPLSSQILEVTPFPKSICPCSFPYRAPRQPVSAQTRFPSIHLQSLLPLILTVAQTAAAWLWSLQCNWSAALRHSVFLMLSISVAPLQPRALRAHPEEIGRASCRERV